MAEKTKQKTWPKSQPGVKIALNHSVCLNLIKSNLKARLCENVCVCVCICACVCVCVCVKKTKRGDPGGGGREKKR